MKTFGNTSEAEREKSMESAGKLLSASESGAWNGNPERRLQSWIRFELANQYVCSDFYFSNAILAEATGDEIKIEGKLLKFR